MYVIVFVLAIWCCLFSVGNGHGRMVEPPMRSSAWRYGFNTTKNYNDNELNCGGFPNQVKHNGMCGPCGDPWQGPRDNEAGGKYAQGVITRHYATGQVINVTVELTSNHKGYFEFRLCPNNNPYLPVTQTCFDQHLLSILGFGTRYPIDAPNRRVFIELQLSLPSRLTCTQCVLQWKWRAAQNRGPDGRGGECFGCGPQEHFINCADVAIGTTYTPIPLNRPSATGGAVVTFDQMNKSAPNTYEVMFPSAKINSFGYEPTQSTNLVDNSNYLTEQASIFSDQGMTPFDTNMEMGVFGGGGQFNHMYGHQPFYDSTVSLFGAEMATTQVPLSLPSVQAHQVSYQNTQRALSLPSVQAHQVSYQNTQSALSTTRALTAAIMAYSSSLGENAGESVYIDGCPDSHIQPTCKGAPVWNNMKSFDNWCSSMCPTGLCPAGVCTCSCPRPWTHSVQHHTAQVQQCRGIPGWSNPTFDKWCVRNCNYDGCSSDFCTCE